jgi:phosphatidylglycerol---prolipoprotein diacylglyceryl transferase
MFPEPLNTWFSPPRDAILIIVLLYFGLGWSEKRVAGRGFSVDTLYNLVYLSLAAGIIGGRLFYAASNWQQFAHNPLDLFSLNFGLFDGFGAIAAALLAAFIYGQRKQMPFWHTLDALTPTFAATMVGIGLAHMASGSAFGAPTSVPWGVELWGAFRHPTQIYETGLALAILGFVMAKNTVEMPGRDFLLFVALTAGAHLLVEGFRGDSILILNGIRLEQVGAWLVLAGALGAEVHRSRQIHQN